MPAVLPGVRGKFDRRAALCLPGSILGMMGLGLYNTGLFLYCSVLYYLVLFLLFGGRFVAQ
jgi:hypothetical protein